MRLRRLLPCVLGLLFIGADPMPASAAPTILELEAPGHATQLLREDVNGDGVVDLILGHGRTMAVWAGATGRLPDAKPTWVHVVTDGQSIVDFAPPSGDPKRPRVVSVGRGGVLTESLPSPSPPTWTKDGQVSWEDLEQVCFVDFVHGGAGVLLPRAHGFDLRPWGGSASTRFEIALDAQVIPAGPFVEDTTDFTAARPHVELAGPARSAGAKGPPTLWAQSGPRLVSQTGDIRTEYDLAFLPDEGERILVDLDGDGRPDILHKSTTNEQGRYGFFRTKPVAQDADGSWPTVGPSHRPANCVIDLPGFQFDPEFVDLDGDGRKDLVLTTIDIDGTSIVSAIVSGKVRARTRAFLNQSAKGGGRWFAQEPSSVVESEAGIKILFTYAGTFDVRRALTLVVDGDYDGDGRKDLAIRTAPDTLSIWLGRNGGWASEPRTVKIPAIGSHVDIEAYAYDANGDKKDELLLVYRTAHEPERRSLGKERLILLSPGF